MSSGKTHAQITALITPPVGLITLAIAGPVYALLATCGCLLGILLSPDLDQPTYTYSEYLMLRFNKLLGTLWVLFWAPYAKAVPHRSRLSHWPILGTLGRVLYLGIPLLLLDVVLPLTIVPAWGHIFAAVIGLAVSDTAHWATDVISTRYKRTQRKLRRWVSRIAPTQSRQVDSSHQPLASGRKGLLW